MPSGFSHIDDNSEQPSSPSKLRDSLETISDKRESEIEEEDESIMESLRNQSKKQSMQNLIAFETWRKKKISNDNLRSSINFKMII